jgi:dephospho-CoA kinase
MKTGITGGIGSGKSYVCKLLAQRGIEVYDCDAAAKRIIRTDSGIREQLFRLIGSLEKADISRFLLASETHAKAIDAIVHPAVFRDFEESGMLWMESAILFESGINRLVDRVVVVTAPLEVRIQRVMQRDGISREQALAWMNRQWSQDEVCRLADYEIVNDGIADLDRQIDTLLNRNNETSK